MDDMDEDEPVDDVDNVEVCTCKIFWFILKLRFASSLVTSESDSTKTLRCIFKHTEHASDWHVVLFKELALPLWDKVTLSCSLISKDIYRSVLLWL